jgi:hypothetical protein
MSKRPIVHIGYHKTATTWFQKSFYPRVEGARYVPRAMVREALIDPSALHFDAATAASILGADTGERLLLCEEGLSGYIHNGGLGGCLSKDMAYRINDVLPDADIVIFIRAQPAMIAACYGQYVKGGGTFSVRRYLFPARFLKGASADAAKAPRFSFDHFDYDRLVAHYVDVFGPDRVHVFLFEQFRAQNRTFLDAFARRLNLDIDIDRVSNRPIYASYNWPALVLSRLLGLFTARTVMDKYYIIHIPFWYAVMRGLGEIVSALGIFRPPSARALLGRRIHDWVERRFAESNARLSARTGLPLGRYGYPLAIEYSAIELSRTGRGSGGTSDTGATGAPSTLPDLAVLGS